MHPELDPAVLRLRSLIGPFLADDETPVRRFGATFTPPDRSQRMNLWIYVTDHRLIYTETHGLMGGSVPMSADPLALLVGIRNWKADIAFFFHDSAATVNQRRFYVGPKKNARELAELVFSLRNELYAPPLSRDALFIADARDAVGWLPPKPPGEPARVMSLAGALDAPKSVKQRPRAVPKRRR